jgi:hypothetical protein
MMTDRSGDGGIPFSPSRRTDNLPAEARPLQETAQSGGGMAPIVVRSGLPGSKRNTG